MKTTADADGARIRTVGGAYAQETDIFVGDTPGPKVVVKSHTGEETTIYPPQSTHSQDRRDGR